MNCRSAASLNAYMPMIFDRDGELCFVMDLVHIPCEGSAVVMDQATLRYYMRVLEFNYDIARTTNGTGYLTQTQIMSYLDDAAFAIGELMKYYTLASYRSKPNAKVSNAMLTNNLALQRLNFAYIDAIYRNSISDALTAMGSIYQRFTGGLASPIKPVINGYTSNGNASIGIVGYARGILFVATTAITRSPPDATFLNLPYAAGDVITCTIAGSPTTNSTWTRATNIYSITTDAAVGSGAWTTGRTLSPSRLYVAWPSTMSLTADTIVISLSTSGGIDIGGTVGWIRNIDWLRCINPNASPANRIWQKTYAYEYVSDITSQSDVSTIQTSIQHLTCTYSIQADVIANIVTNATPATPTPTPLHPGDWLWHAGGGIWKCFYAGTDSYIISAEYENLLTNRNKTIFRGGSTIIIMVEKLITDPVTGDIVSSSNLDDSNPTYTVVPLHKSDAILSPTYTLLPTQTINTPASLRATLSGAYLTIHFDPAISSDGSTVYTEWILENNEEYRLLVSGLGNIGIVEESNIGLRLTPIQHDGIATARSCKNNESDSEDEASEADEPEADIIGFVIRRCWCLDERGNGRQKSWHRKNKKNRINTCYHDESILV